MSEKRFTDELARITYAGEEWRCRMHKRMPSDSMNKHATAVVIEKAATDRLTRRIDMRKAGRVVFGPARRRTRLRLSRLKSVVGRASWAGMWEPKLVKVLGTAVVDRVLFARALSCRANDEVVTLEVGKVGPKLNYGCGQAFAIRVIGKGWRAVIASTTDSTAPALRLRK